MPYRRSNRLPAMIVHMVKLYAKKSPWLLAAIGAVLALTVLGATWMVLSCVGGSCPSACARGEAKVEAAKTYDSPCARWKAEQQKAQEAGE